MAAIKVPPTKKYIVVDTYSSEIFGPFTKEEAQEQIKDCVDDGVDITQIFVISGIGMTDVTDYVEEHPTYTIDD